MSKNLESRIGRLEDRLGQKAQTVICYFNDEETLEQRKQRFKEEPYETRNQQNPEGPC